MRGSSDWQLKNLWSRTERQLKAPNVQNRRDELSSSPSTLLSLTLSTYPLWRKPQICPKHNPCNWTQTDHQSSTPCCRLDSSVRLTQRYSLFTHSYLMCERVKRGTKAVVQKWWTSQHASSIMLSDSVTISLIDFRIPGKRDKEQVAREVVPNRESKNVWSVVREEIPKNTQRQELVSLLSDPRLSCLQIKRIYARQYIRLPSVLLSLCSRKESK